MLGDFLFRQSGLRINRAGFSSCVASDEYFLFVYTDTHNFISDIHFSFIHSLLTTIQPFFVCLFLHEIRQKKPFRAKALHYAYSVKQVKHVV